MKTKHRAWMPAHYVATGGHSFVPRSTEDRIAVAIADEAILKAALTSLAQTIRNKSREARK